MNFLLKVNRPHTVCSRFARRRRLFSSDASTRQLLEQLSALDTASLCDADKSLVATNDSYRGLQLMQGLKPLNCHENTAKTMVGTARTVQCREPNDFLAVLQGLHEAESGEVLVVNTLNSTRAVAGELFCAEAQRRGLVGIVVEGPMRDTAYLDEFSSSEMLFHTCDSLLWDYSSTG